MKVLIIGSGGREHALGWALSKDPEVTKIYFGPGNGGTSLIGTNLAEIVPTKFETIAEACEKKPVDLVLCGPEDPLAMGLYDFLTDKKIKAIGPSEKGAMLESSKSFAKNFMKWFDIPTADFKEFVKPGDAIDFANTAGWELVIKCDGLAAGKGVFLPKSKKVAEKIIKDMLVDRKFGDSSAKIVIEKKLEGFESTLLCFADGKTIAPMLFSQDYKRAYDKNEGPNTGGMGCLCPSPRINNNLKEEITKRIIEPTLRGLKEHKIDYKGFLYFGLMITNDGPNLLEYNIRMGDPESQVVLPLLKTEFSKPLNMMIDGNLSGLKLDWHDKHAVGVVLASKGYPGSYEKGVPIDYLKEWDVPSSDFIMFHAGTKRYGKSLFISGGRVVCLTALGGSFAECREKIYKRIEKLELAGLFYRSDIAAEYV